MRFASVCTFAIASIIFINVDASDSNLRSTRKKNAASVTEQSPRVSKLHMKEEEGQKERSLQELKKKNKQPFSKMLARQGVDEESTNEEKWASCRYPGPPTRVGCTVLNIELKTDDWPEETVIILEDATSGDDIWVCSDYEPNTAYTFSRCIPDTGCAYLDITDTEGDGLLNTGNMKVTYGTQTLYDSWDFGSGFDIYLGDGCE